MCSPSSSSSRTKPMPSSPPSPPPRTSYEMSLPRWFVGASLAGAAAMAFAAGQACHRLMPSPETAAASRGLPPPMVKGRKFVPSTVYTTKNYDTSRSVSSSLFLQTDPRDAVPVSSASPSASSPVAEAIVSASPSTSPEEDSIGIDSEETLDDEEIHLPAGQHLLVDFNNVDSSFLNSESRLAVAMVEMVYECGLTMLSYHCHQLFPSGVSCAGVLLESHVSFHTWPEDGVITLDLFTCGASSLLPMVPMIEELFGIPQSKGAKKPEVLWAYKRRGFTDLDQHGNDIERVQHQDLFAYPLGSRGLEMKQEIVSMETYREQQLEHRVRVYDVIQAPVQSYADYEKSLRADGSYFARNAELFRPDRLVFVDGSIRARRSRDAEAHELLVHPAMLAHSSSNRVAVVGSGTDGGAALREVLKHATVRRATTLISEPTMVDMVREHMSDWNDCSNIVGSSTSSCLDDKRVQVASGEAPSKWMAEQASDSFDVMIVDALLIESEITESFLKDAFASLSADGVLTIHMTKDAVAGDLPVSPTRRMNARALHEHNLAILVNHLERVGFVSTRVYDENHDGYANTRAVVVAFKQGRSSERFDRPEPQVRLDMVSRIAKTKDGASPFRVFDGASMSAYRKQQNAADVFDLLKSAHANRLQKSATTSGVTSSDNDVDSNVSAHGGRPVFRNDNALGRVDLLRVQPFLASLPSI